MKQRVSKDQLTTHAGNKVDMDVASDGPSSAISPLLIRPFYRLGSKSIL